MFNKLSQKWFSMVSLVPAIALAALLGTAGSAKATGLAYEGFNYDPGLGIAGLNGGIGWIAPWISGGNFVYGTNVSGSLGYTDPYGHVLPTTGNSMVVGNWTSTSASQPSRTLADFKDGTNFLSGGTYWISFLAQRIGSKYDTQPMWGRQANLALFITGTPTAQGSERFDVGRPNTNSFTGLPYDTWSIWHSQSSSTSNGTANAQPSSYPLATAAGATFFLLRIDTDATTANDTAYVWMNWTNLTIAPSISTATLVDGWADLSFVNQIRFQCNGASGVNTNAMLRVDELRVGTTFADAVNMVPEPSAILLATLGGLGLLLLRQRRR